MKKILFIHHGSEKGGAPISLLYTAKGVQENGYLPIIGLARPTDGLHKLYNDHNLETIDLPEIPVYIYCSSSNLPLYHFRSWLKLFRGIIKHKPGQQQLLKTVAKLKVDIVHLNSMALSLSAYSLKKYNIPYVWHIREYGPKIQDFRYQWLKDQMLKASATIFLSEGERQSWIQEKSKNSYVVHNFVDVNKFNSSKESPSKEIKEILFVGGLKQNKGIEILIETLNILQTSKVEFRCIMPGALAKNEIDNADINTGFEDKVLQKIDNYNLQSRIKRTGFNPNIINLFENCDVLVFPAKYPHFARPIVEASALGKPVVATDLPPLDELVINNKTGFLVPYKAKDFADKISLLLQDEPLSKRMGIEGRALIEKEFNAISQVRKIVEVYKSISKP